MAECEWLMLADYLFADAQSKLCVNGIFDVIYAADTPATHDRAFIAFCIVGEPGESARFKLEIIGPNGKAIWEAENDITLPDAGTAFGGFEVRGLTLLEFGQHAIQADFGGGAPKTAWFTLRKRPQQ